MLIFLMLLLYTWLLYPTTVVLLSRFKAPDTRSITRANSLTTSVVIPVYNSANLIEQKIQNCRELDQGANLPIIIISDGSDDNVDEIVSSLNDQNLSFIELPQRSGKSAAQNLAVQNVKTDLILFTDVDTMLNKSALTKLISRLQDSSSIACVGGRIEFKNPNIFQALYWRFENTLRNSESRLGLLTSISGAAFLLRADKFIPLDLDTGDDMVIPLDMKLHHNLDTAFSNQVIATDQLAKNETDIFNSRRRMTQRNLLVVSRRKQLLNPLSNLFLSVSIFSHKILRWFTPFLLICACINLASAIITHIQLWEIMLLVLSGSYLVFTGRNFFIEIAGLLMGLIDFLKGSRTTYY